MSRIIQFMMAVLLLVGIAGCGNSDKPADPSATPKVDDEQVKKNMENQMKSRMPNAPEMPTSAPAGDKK